MQGGYARGVRRQAARQARAMVELLGHHPSIVLWCAHDAPLGDDAPARARRERDRADVGQGGARPVDARARSRAYDGTRPVVRSSGAGDDTHLWFGWRHGDLAGLAPAVRAVPAPRPLRLRVRRAVGARHRASGCSPERGPTSTGTTSPSTTGMERGAFDTHVPPADAKSFDEWRDATQAYQAALLQLQIEDLRRCKGTPCGGFAVFCLADPSSGGRLRSARPRPRARSARTRAVRDACRPVLADGRSPHRQRARRRTTPARRSPTPRSWSRSTAGPGTGAATSTPTRSCSSVGRSRRRGRRRGRAHAPRRRARSRTATRS